ncbi:TipJ family phage tail tip protein [Edwardsiella tarda]
MGKGRAKQHTPYEAPDSLKSTQRLSIIDAISEGPIEGPVAGLASVYLNDTPAIDDEGNSNINGLTVIYNAGTQEQAALEGFEASGAETIIGSEVKATTPITRTITSANIDRLRLTLGVVALQSVSDEGDRDISSVTLRIQLQRDGHWQDTSELTLRGKTTSQFLTSVVLDDLPPRPFGVRVVRVTPDSTSDQLQNRTLWSSYTEIIDIRQRYPNTAVVGLLVNSEQFGSQQVRRTYLVRGRIIQVPANYDPHTRHYEGLWQGDFKAAWSNNPAWVLYDLLTHPRYGLGWRVGALSVDKWALYAIARYCDQPVPDGYGGSEPRMTCNASLSEQRKAYDVINDLCSIMRCMPVWNGQTLTFVQDRPSDAVWSYSNANVVEGRFNYTFSALKARHSAAEIRFVDPDNGWRVSTEYVADEGMIARYGLNVLKLDAFGCTCRGQAYRMGLWALTSEKLETQMVTFSLGMEGIRHLPGDIIEICDNDYAGIALGGRLLEVGEGWVRLDRPVNVETFTQLLVADRQGRQVSVAIHGQPAPDQLHVSALPPGCVAFDCWSLRQASLRPRLFRCLEIVENGDGSYGVTALQHVPEKESIVDNGAHFDPKPPTIYGIVPPAVQHLTVEISEAGGQYQAWVRWDTPRMVNGIRFLLQLKIQDGEVQRLVGNYTTSACEYRLYGLTLGHYQLSVRSVSVSGLRGDPTEIRFVIAAPEAPIEVAITPGYFQFTVTPRQTLFNPETQFEFWFSPRRLHDLDQIVTQASYLGSGRFWVVSGAMIRPGQNYYLYVRSVNTVGKSAFVEAVGQASNDAAGYLDFFAGQIGRTHLAQALREQIALGAESSGQIEEINQSWQDLQGRLNTLWGVRVQQLQDGRHYIAGLGVGIENDAQGEVQSQILLLADRLVMLDPDNGATTPLFVVQEGQMWLNELLLKRLIAASIISSGNPPTFVLTPEGELFARQADISGHVNATSGRLSHVTIDESCEVKEIRAETIKGDIVKVITLRLGTPLQISAAPFDRLLFAMPVAAHGTTSTNTTTSGKDGRDISSTSYSGTRIGININGREVVVANQLGSGVDVGTAIEPIPAATNITLELWVEKGNSNHMRRYTDDQTISMTLNCLLYKA